MGTPRPTLTGSVDFRRKRQPESKALVPILGAWERIKSRTSSKREGVLMGFELSYVREGVLGVLGAGAGAKRRRVNPAGEVSCAGG